MESFHHDISARKKESFARAMMKALRDAGHQTKLRYDATRFCIDAEDGTLFLRNPCTEFYAVSPHQRPEVIRQLARTFFKGTLLKEAGLGEYEDACPDLFPRIRDRATFEVQRLEAEILNRADWDDSFVPFAEHLGIGLAYDMPESLVFVARHHLTEWGKTFDQALADASRNLEEITSEPMKRVIPGLWMSSRADSHDSARLILTDYIRAHQVKGEHVAMVPNRDTLLVTGSEDVEGLTRMASMAEQRQVPWGVSGIAVCLRENQWLPFMPETKHPAYQRFRRLACNTIAQGYAGQKKVLDLKREDQGFVPSVMVFETTEGKVGTYCAWIEGLRCALPQADYVAFVNGQLSFPTLPPMSGPANTGDLLKPWKRVQEVVGHLMTPMNLYPDRYLVEEFPSAKQLTAIGGNEPLS